MFDHMAAQHKIPGPTFNRKDVLDQELDPGDHQLLQQLKAFDDIDGSDRKLELVVAGRAVQIVEQPGAAKRLRADIQHGL